MRVERRALPIALLLLLLTAFVQAQDQEAYSSAAPGKFSCGSDATASFPPVTGLFSDFSGMSLTALPDKPAELPADVHGKSFGPFDEKQFGFRSVEFYQFLTGKDTGGVQTGTEAHIYLRVLRSSGEAWYAVAAKDPHVLNADPPSQQEDDSAASEDAEQSQQPKDDAPVSVSTPDAALPLFQLSYTSRWLGANAGGGYRHVLLLDLRNNPPQVARHMQCLWGEGGGVCTAIDSGFGSNTQLSCQWDRQTADYRCRQRVNTTAGWGGRFDDSEYFLLTGKDAFQLPEDSPGSLERFVGTLGRRPADAQKLLLPDAGEATAIYSLLQQKHDLYLFAARGRGEALDARFFLVERPYTDRPVTSVELQSTTASQLKPVGFAQVELERERALQPSTPKVTSRAGGDSLSYNVRKLYGNDDFFVLQVTVKEGNSHAVYWLGIDQRQEAIVADLYRIATDADLYAGCGNYQHQESATAYRLLPGAGFRALLQVEPAHTVRPNEVDGGPSQFLAENLGREAEELPPVCTWRLSWDGGKGFVFAEHPVRCRSVAPRSIVISDDGKLTTTPITQPAPAEDPHAR